MKTRASATAALTSLILAGFSVQAATVAQWSFPDQGATSNADLSATTVSDAVAGDITPGTGYEQLVQIVGGTNYTYIDSAQNSGNATHTDGTGSTSSDTAFFVGDWDDGSSGDTGGGEYPDPSGAGPGGAGALYLISPAADKDGGANGWEEAVGNNLGLTFDVTASGGTWDITDFSFYGARFASGNEMNWEYWHLQADTGSGFTTLFSSALDAINTSETWDLQQATSFSVSIANGETATFRLIGQSRSTNTYSRGVALDELSLEGTFTPIPEPASMALFGLSGLGLLGRRRRR